MKNIYIILSILLIASGCDSFLDKQDPEATTFQEFFNTEEDLRRVVYSSYLDVFTSGGTHQMLFYMQEGRSDNAYSRVDGHHQQRLANGDFNSSSQLFLWHWENHGKHTGRLNTFIANIDAPYVENESIREKYKGILEALRVWHYFMMTAQWGDVPFHLEPADMVTAQQPVTTKEEILDKLFEIVDNVTTKMSVDEYKTDKYMFNANSFKALAARYALFNGRYELAAKYAKDVINSGKYQLHPSYKDLFQYEAASNNKEFIMHMDKDCSGTRYSFRDLGPHFRTGGGQSYVVPLKSLVDSYWTLQGNPIDKCPLHTKEEYELNPKLNRDPRYEASIMGHGDLFYGEEINIYDENGPMFHEKERASRSGYWFKKYVSENDAFRDNGTTTLEFSLLRYAEILLTYVEAKIMLNQIDDEVKGYINDIRRRAGLDMTQADVKLPKYSSYTQEQWIDLVRNERRIELAGEGIRYLDIIRWKIAEAVLNQPALGHTRKATDGKLVSLKIEDRSFKAPYNYKWPFHETSLRIESGLVQNSGY